MESFLLAGLSYDTNETVLKDAFDSYGKIVEGGGVTNYDLLEIFVAWK